MSNIISSVSPLALTVWNWRPTGATETALVDAIGKPVCLPIAQGFWMDMVPLAFVPSARTSSQRTRVALGRGGARANYYHCVFTVMNQVLDNKYLNERYTYRMVDRRLHSTIQWYGPGIGPKPYEPEFDPSEEYTTGSSSHPGSVTSRRSSRWSGVSTGIGFILRPTLR